MAPDRASIYPVIMAPEKFIPSRSFPYKFLFVCSCPNIKFIFLIDLIPPGLMHDMALREGVSTALLGLGTALLGLDKFSTTCPNFSHLFPHK